MRLDRRHIFHIYRRVVILALVGLFVGFFLSSPEIRADPTSRPEANSLPASFIEKLPLTPHFFQRDPRWDLTTAGMNYCVPTSVSDSLIYFANHGFARLFQEQDNQELAQVEMIRKLASSKYMATNPVEGTSPSGALAGVRLYVEEHGYKIHKLQYAGWRVLKRDLRNEQIGVKPDLNWVKSAIVAPNGTAWMEIGFYTHGDGPNEWKRMAGHAVVAVGYGTDGNRSDPNLFVVDNPALGKKVLVGKLASHVTRDLTIADQVITVTLSGPMVIIPMQGPKPGPRRAIADSYRITGPGVPFSTKKYDAAFLDGVIVMEIEN